MSNYHRAHVPGASYFFTVNLADRGSRLLLDQIAALRDAFRATKQQLPFRLDAVVVLPEHLHCIWTMPAGDSDFSGRWQRIKSRFSVACTRCERRSASRARRRERGIWQRRFWEHMLRDEFDFATHVDYIHHNPVKHGYVTKPTAWPHSSIHRFVREGWLPADWACGEPSGDFGER
jgi:putative transposase